MSLHFGLVTMQTCFGPLMHITIDTWPNIAGSNQVLFGMNTGIRELCKESNTLRRNFLGIKGRGTPIDISQSMVVSVVGNGIAFNSSEYLVV